jgi:DNA damage-binding protein 2
VSTVSSPFDKRITTLSWHPKLHNMLAVGSKAGDIIVWNLNKQMHNIFVKGVPIFFF